MGNGEVNGERGEVKSERGEVAAKCPECGTARSERTPAVPWVVRHRIKFKIAALLLVLGLVVWKNVQSWPVLPAPTTYVGGLATFPAHRYTKSDIERYASGEIKDGRLIDDLFSSRTGSIFSHSFDDFDLRVAFISPAGFRHRVLGYGWPAWIADRSWQGNYDDVYAMTNPVYGTNDPGLKWSGLNFEFHQQDEQGRPEAFYFRGAALLAPFLVMVVAWNVGRALRLAFFALRAADKNGTRLRDRLLRRAPLLCIATGAIVTVAASFQPAAALESFLPKNLQSTRVKTGLTTGDLKGLVNDPGGEAKVALAILEATRGAAVQDDQVLVVGFTSEVERSTATGVGGWPTFLVFTTNERADRAEEDRSRSPRISLDLTRGGLVVFARWGNPVERVDTYAVATRGAAKIGFGLCVTWWLAAVAIWLTNKRAHRQAKKRVARGYCVRCGYDLKGL